MLKTAVRYWNTVRWLRPVQVYGRLWFRLRKARPSLASAPARRDAKAVHWICCARNQSLVGPTRFKLLGVEREVVSPADWNRAEWPKLWLYNAHYFDDLAADHADRRREWHRSLIERWIAQNPVCHGTGWEPYPISLRIVNWIKWAWTQQDLNDSAARSLAIQTRALTQRLEHHLLGNHLWANAKALVFAGTFFQGPEAESWKQRGLALLKRELDEQVLNDGGHFERSPMYHAIVLEDVLDIVQLSTRFPGLFDHETLAHWREVAVRMLKWLCALSHPDGRIAFFNDAAWDIAPHYDALVTYASALGVPIATTSPRDGVLRDTGFARIASASAVLLADVGSVAPSYLPGHAHAGTLSFELSIGNRRVLVNSGTSTYATESERLRQRGTAAHNTVVINGEDSSEVWGSFRVARRAHVHSVRESLSPDLKTLSASHNGYTRFSNGVTHQREWQLHVNELSVTDTLHGSCDTAEARYHFAPGERLRCAVDGGTTRIEASTWHPRFGESVPNEVLVVTFTQPRCQVTFSWD